MNSLKFYISLIVLTIIISCSSKQQDETNASKNLYTQQPDSTVLRFLKWYHQNEEELNRLHFFKGGLNDTTTFYSVDYTNTEIYLARLLSSQCLSNKFIADFRNYFIQGDLYLKRHPQNDGPVDGFDYDLIMKSQDYMDVWDNLDSMKTLSREIIGNKAIIKVSFGKYHSPSYNLTNVQGRWLIDSIYNVYNNN